MNEPARVTVERWLGALASGEVAAAVDAVAPNVVLHGTGSAVRGRSSVSFVLTSLRAAFPDLRLETEVLAAEGTWVIVRFTANGTQQIALFGLRAGDRREITGVGCFSVGNQGIADVCVYVDAGQFVKQFGLRPARASSDGTESNEQSGSWLERFTGGARAIWLAGVGALGAAGEHGERLFHSLVEQGRMLESSGRERLSSTAETVEAKTRAIGERARSVASGGQEYIRDVASGVRGGLGLPTRQEFDELSRKVEQLTARMESTASASSGSDVHHSADESTSS